MTDERQLGGPGIANTWVDWVVHVRWSTTNTGLIEVWRDGHKVAAINDSTDDFPDPASPDTSNYIKIGIYKWPWSQPTPNPPSEVTHRRMYADELRIADGTGRYDAVAPRGAARPSSGVLQPAADRNPRGGPCTARQVSLRR
jgi:Polysaccharide lyase